MSLVDKALQRYNKPPIYAWNSIETRFILQKKKKKKNALFQRAVTAQLITEAGCRLPT